MASNPERVYWDSCIYLDYLRGEHDRGTQIDAVVEDWLAGEVELVTSSLTIAEVLYVKPGDGGQRQRLTREVEPELRALFEPSGTAKFRLVELSRVTAIRARELFWDHGIKPKDAVHVASALEANCEIVMTTDQDLLRFSGHVGGQPVLRIIEPEWNVQTELDFFAPRD